MAFITGDKEKMITDEKIGLVVAENEEEEMWFKTKTNVTNQMKELRQMMKFNEALLELCEQKLSQNETKDNNNKDN